MHHGLTLSVPTRRSSDLRHHVGAQRRQADAEVDAGAVRDRLGGPPGELAAAQPGDGVGGHGHMSHSRSLSMCMTRSTNTDGVTMTSGSRAPRGRSEEHTSELQSLMRISYAVFCLK